MHYDKNWLINARANGEAVSFFFFWGHTAKANEKAGKACFSQWFESPFMVDGIIYKTAEHWMMAQKALLFNDQAAFDKIIQCETPAEAKALGRTVQHYDDAVWNEKKFALVKAGNLHKFRQHAEMAAFLLSTGNKVIGEASPVDAIWGIGLSENSRKIYDPSQWRGENLPGFALMEVRDYLKAFIQNSQPYVPKQQLFTFFIAFQYLHPVVQTLVLP
ncbi:NADAR family protein [Flavihumibacter petaseus]|uniref:NADAR domain-containing protein n=1 Tax=Flavihumibacter petaseus NBRC 106054 TaxID=1220578 RepID=A0A0E9N496_9BACT|nr:NADAR family protein [Flavihumibacter petaseus]GAO44613.1 hypothetical protein FPE01S_03_06510 [Flavihumibacter petaseus NBRC 106054]